MNNLDAVIRDYHILRSYDDYFQNYLNDLMELDADTKGIKYAENYKKVSGFDGRGKIGTQSQNNGTKKKWSLGTNTRNSSTEGEYSTEPSEYKQVKIIKDK